MEKLVLIDGNSLINRAFYAMPVLTTKEGTPTNAVFGFMNMFFKLYQDVKPDYVAVAFDVHAPTFRHELYKEYKGTRKPMPDELRPQIPLLKEILTKMNVFCIEKAGIEADDIIGTIAKNTDLDTYIYTGDKDSFQLVDNSTRVCFTKRGITDLDVYTLDNFYEKTALSPKQIIEYKALRGDTSDNIPGVLGIGEKTALSLLNDYSNLEGVYENLDALKPGVKQKLIEHKQDAFFSRVLATIKTDCDVNYSLNDMRFSLPVSSEVKDLFTKLELKSLLTKKELFSSDSVKAETKALDLPTPTLVSVSSLDELDVLFNKDLTVAYQPNGINFYSNGAEYLARFNQTLLDDGFNISLALEKTALLIKNAKSVLVYDKKELRHALSQISFNENFNADDLSILKYLVDFSGKAETLTSLLENKGLNKNLPAFAVYKIFSELKSALLDDKIKRLYFDLELPLSDLLFDMEMAGFKVDALALSELGISFNKKIDLLKKQICAFAQDDTLNINSAKQLGVVLFEKLKIGKGKKTKTGYNTSAEVLSSLEDNHPIIPLILEYRKLQKILSTYIDGFKPLIDVNTGLVHTCFNQTTTSTGRLSSKEPNLQNIPVRNDEGKELRKFFVPRDKNRVLISADYSQIELRLLASFALCKPLIDAFNNGEDIHRITASKVFNVPLERVSEGERRKAKAVNFGIIYGISEYGLAKQIKTSAKEAKEYIYSYFNEYPEIKSYMNSIVDFAKKNGYATTILGRKRYIKELFDPSPMVRQFGERASMNMPLQGSSADIIKLAMLAVDARLKKEKLKSQLILQIHDELIIDALTEEQEKVEKILVEEMENVVSLPVRLTVSIGKGKSWYEAK